MDYNERNGSYSDDELLSRFSRTEPAGTDDIPDDPASSQWDRVPRPGIRMASGRPMRGKKQGPAGRRLYKLIFAIRRSTRRERAGRVSSWGSRARSSPAACWVFCSTRASAGFCNLVNFI